jgi:hypothetical protein
LYTSASKADAWLLAPIATCGETALLAATGSFVVTGVASSV